MRLRYLHLSAALFLLTLLTALLSRAGSTSTQAQTQRAGSVIEVARVLPQRGSIAAAAAFPATMSEDFENAWPAPGWSLQDIGSSGGEYLFGQRNCQPQNGTFAGWSVGGGADGTTLPCGSQYPNNVTSLATYGPFDLSTAASSMLTFSYRGASEPSFDFLYIGAAIDGINYCGYTIDGDHDSGYAQDSFDLSNIQCTDFPSSFLGYASVTILFYFKSDDNVTDVGFMVDDIALTTIVSPPTNTPTDTPTATPTDTPTATPTDTPTATPPTETPTTTPSATPTNTPTDTPTATPPTETPTTTPTTTLTPGTPPPVYLPITIRELALPTFTPTPSPPPPPACADIEGNNNIEDSKQLTTINNSCSGSFQDQLNDPMPEDYYWFQPSIGQHITVDLTSIQSGANYDIALVLRDNQGKYGRVVGSEKPGQADEHFEYTVTSNQRHYIRVRAIAKSPSVKNTYILTVAIN